MDFRVLRLPFLRPSSCKAATLSESSPKPTKNRKLEREQRITQSPERAEAGFLTLSPLQRLLSCNGTEALAISGKPAIEAEIITNTVVGVPHYSYSIMVPQTLFPYITQHLKTLIPYTPTKGSAARKAKPTVAQVWAVLFDSSETFGRSHGTFLSKASRAVKRRAFWNGFQDLFCRQFGA